MEVEIVISIAILVFSVVIHEISHGYAAYLLGDPTAKYAGRLTFNPVKHLDVWGSVVIPFLLILSNAGVVFGWAKPVPYNPYNLRNQKWGPAMVGIAGPASNMLLVIIAGLSMHYLNGSGSIWFDFFGIMARINILLLIFNMLPIPPLDGSKLLFTILPISEQTKATLEQYGFVILLAFVFLFHHAISSLVNTGWLFFLELVAG
ncbi:MAG TPA: site-2 protease family protein [Candidatus Moranbacteria bacterium]|nr:site-2 protease family protein [Candidatus Moranbacteria bacterium]